MATHVKMPKFGLSMEEGTIAAWLKQEGEAVQKGEPIAEITTEKITNTVEAPTDGILLKILAQEEETLPCGAVLAYIGEEGEIISDSFESLAALADEKIKTGQTQPPFQDPVLQTIFSEQEDKNETKPATVQSQKRPLAEIVITPKAEKLAREKGIDYNCIVGTGIGGAITISDIKNYLASVGSKQTTEQSPVEPVRESKMGNMRNIIADRMLGSLRNSAQTTMVLDVDVTDLTKLYKQKREEFKAKNVKLSYTAILIKAVANALSKHERFRTVITDNNTLLTKSEINIGVAVDLEDGLLVPVLRNADQKDLETICGELEDLAKRARENRLTVDELNGGTMTITNLGMYGIKYFTPILNLPESAILGVGSITEQPVIVAGGIHIKSVMTLSLTHDHRIIDGAPAARFLNEIKQILQEPQALF